MSWSPATASSHAERLTRLGWAERVSMARGEGSMLYATPLGIRVAGLPLIPPPPPAPTWWAHLAGCAWTAAWLTARGRTLLGPRELLEHNTWQGELEPHPGQPRICHRPDLIGVVAGRRPAAIEVELARKSKQRLRAILALHAQWIAAGQSGACVYVCGDEAIAKLVTDQARQAGLVAENGSLRVELLATVKQLAVLASNSDARDPRAAGVLR